MENETGSYLDHPLPEAGRRGNQPENSQNTPSLMILGPGDDRSLVKEKYPDDLLTGLFVNNPKPHGPWHAIFRIQASWEDDRPIPAGSGFATDLLAEAPDGRSLMVILTAAHVLFARNKPSELATRVAVFNADGKLLVESERSSHCSFAVSQRYMSTTSVEDEEDEWWDYGAIFLDLGTSFFPSPLSVDCQLSRVGITELAGSRSGNKCSVAGYPATFQGKTKEQLVVGSSMVFCSNSSRRDVKAQAAGSDTGGGNGPVQCSDAQSVKAPLLFHTVNASPGESGSPMYQEKKGKDPESSISAREWQAVGIHIGPSKSFSREVTKMIEFQPKAGEPNPADIFAGPGWLAADRSMAEYEQCNAALALVDEVVSDILSWPKERPELQDCYNAIYS